MLSLEKRDSTLKSKIPYILCLEDFALEVIIGILPNERKDKQKILVNAEFLCMGNLKFALTQTNALKNIESQDFLDYRILKEFIKDAFECEFGLLEEAQSYFYQQIPLRFPQIKEFWIKITKLEIFDDCKVSIKINYQN